MPPKRPAGYVSFTYVTPTKYTFKDGYYGSMQGMTAGVDGRSQKISNQGLSIGGRLMSQSTLNKGWGIQGFGFYRSPQP